MVFLFLSVLREFRQGAGILSPQGGAMEEIEKLWDRRARFYDWTLIPMELMGMKKLRKRALQYIKGPEVLEVGVVTGKNLPLYPPGLHITGIDASQRMLEKAHGYAGRMTSLLDLHVMDVQSLTFPDNSFDTVLATCVFCSVPDPVKGLMEIGRVCKPKGRVVLLEHMRP